jgi:hypothetical protein
MTAFTSTGWLTALDCRLYGFRAVVETTTEWADYPYAYEVREDGLVYSPRLRHHTAPPEDRRDAQAERARALAYGPSIVVLADAFPSPVSSTAPPLSSRR